MVLRKEGGNFRLVISIKQGACIISENCSLGVKASVLQMYSGSQSCTEIIVIDILKVQVVSGR